jgi:hypothetical protein
MRISRAQRLIAAGLIAAFCAATPVLAQDDAQPAPKPEALLPPTPAPSGGAAVDAAQAMASAIDGAGGGITGADQIAALKDAGAAGDPMALWQLGLMYENGNGVVRNRAIALGYFSEIANQYADTAPRSTDADIVAQAFVKMGDYFADGLPEAGIAKNTGLSIGYLKQAANWFGNSEAQYRLAQLYLDPNGLANPLQGARYLQAASKRGYIPAQARLGDLLFNGNSDVKANPIEGLTLLTVASRRADGTIDATWIDDLLNADMSVATTDERSQAVDRADSLAEQFAAADAAAATAN